MLNCVDRFRNMPSEIFRRAVLATVLVPLFSAGADAQLVDCATVEDQWRHLPLGASHEDRARIYDQAFNDSDCDGAVVETIGKEIIEARLETLAPFQDLDGFGGDPEHLKQELLDLHEFGSHWRVSFLLGEIHRKQRQAVPALKAYQEALGLVDDEELTPAEPAHAMIARLRDRLDEMAVVVAQISSDPKDIKIPVT